MSELSKRKVDAIRPMLSKLLDGEWDHILKPLLMKRITLMLDEVAEQQEPAPATTFSCQCCTDLQRDLCMDKRRCTVVTAS
jgi:hypothetical protein